MTTLLADRDKAHQKSCALRPDCETSHASFLVCEERDVGFVFLLWEMELFSILELFLSFEKKVHFYDFSKIILSVWVRTRERRGPGRPVQLLVMTQ